MKRQCWADCPPSGSSTGPCCLPWGQASCRSEGREEQGRKQALWAAGLQVEGEEVAVQFFLPNSPVKSAAPPPVCQSERGAAAEKPGEGMPGDCSGWRCFHIEGNIRGGEDWLSDANHCSAQRRKWIGKGIA